MKTPRCRHWTIVPAALLCGLLLTACHRPKTAAPAPPPEVATIKVVAQSVLLATELPGRTTPFQIAEIRPQVSGLIQERLFAEGAVVSAGQALYRIDAAPFQAALDNALAALGRAQANLPALQSRAERYQAALADQAVGQQDFDDAASAFKQAQADVQFYQAAVDAARINLKYTGVTSPIAGRIGRSSVTVGAIVTAYQPAALATIQQLDPIYVDVPQSTSELLQLRRRLNSGQLNQSGADQMKVQLVLEDHTAYPLEGTLQFRDISVDPTTGSVMLRTVFPNPDGVLLPGMFVRAVIKEGVNETAILVPQQAVSRDTKGNPVVLLVDQDDKVAQRQLGLERALGNQWLVAAGLTPGDRVIVEGMQKVRPGMPVREVPFNPDTPAKVAGATNLSPAAK